MSRGGWVFVCGPSGAGKDSVIAWARAALAADGGIVFARRVVTRASHESAEHDEMSRAGFAQALHAGRFAWHWQAHGFGYGIDAQYRAEVARGRLVVVNGSREHVLQLAPGQAALVLVTAPPDLLARRLRARGRDSAAAVEERLARNQDMPGLPGAHVIVNDGEIAAAGARLRDHLRALRSAREAM
jgi:phosphonate metabolism protein PhnN/1,5-bisphosphokinase (PRPP-forming)